MNMQAIYQLNTDRIMGMSASISVYEDRITVRCDYDLGKTMNKLTFGMANLMKAGMGAGDKTTYFSDITSVQFKKADSTPGHILFTMPGGSDGVQFLDYQNGIAEQIAVFINNAIRKSKTSEVSAITNSVADEIRKLKALLDEGIITHSEFEFQKNRLLSQ